MASESIHPSYIKLSPKRKERIFTLEEYLRKEAKSVDKHEFFSGKIIKMPYAKGPHNIIAANISAEMIFAFKKTENKFVVFSSDQKIYFPDLNMGVYADALAVAEKPLYWDEEELLLINPLLAVEVLSKSTARYDRSGKFDKYKTLESFKEYVLIRQDQCYTEVWYRERPGFWQETIVTDLSGNLPLQSVGINLSMRDIYHNVIL